MQQIFGVYVHARPDRSVFYVGKGTKKRAQRFKRRKNSHYNNIVQKYGKENIIVTWDSCSSEREAYEQEKILIKFYRSIGVKLANISDGGEGVSREIVIKAQTGRVKTQLERDNLSRALKGRIFTPEWKEKIRKALTGKRQSIESNLKRSRTQKGRPGKPLSQETKAKISYSLRQRHLKKEQ